MRFLTENKIIFHPGKIQPDGTFVGPDGKPYDLIPCDPSKLAKKMSKKSREDSSEEDPLDKVDDDDWIDLDTFDPYEGVEEEDTDFAPDEIDKEIEIDLGDDESEEGKEKKDKESKKPPKTPPKDPKDLPGDPPKDPLPPDGPIKPSKEKSKIIKGKLVDPHTFITADGRTIKL